jgi:hypothetical protein
VNRRALLALFLAASCSRPAPKQAPTHPAVIRLPTDTINEQSSLLDIARGATVISRTGETMLSTSAMNTIDGEITSSWSPPPHDYPQSIVIALHTTSRIDRVGFRSLITQSFEANHLIFESSGDGVAWQPLVTMTSRHVDEAQWQNVTPADAAYLRVTIPDAKNPGRDVNLQSLLAHGTEVGAPRQVTIDGCWSINGSAASFTQRGTRATGVAAIGKEPMFLAGGSNGRMWRFNWIRGNDYGYTALTISPDGRKLSALNWHEEAIPLFRAAPWFGERVACSAVPQTQQDVPAALLRRIGRVSMFALQFDDSGVLRPDDSRDELQSLAGILRDSPVALRIVAHEFRQPDARRNKEVADREIASVRDALAHLGVDITRVDFVAAGSDAPRQTPASDAARAIYSSVDVEVRR